MEVFNDTKEKQRTLGLPFGNIWPMKTKSTNSYSGARNTGLEIIEGPADVISFNRKLVEERSFKY